MEQRNSEGTTCSKRMRNWSVDDVVQWLSSLDLHSDVLEEFRRQRITGQALVRLEEKHFEQMQSVMIGDQLVITEARNELLAKEQAETAALQDNHPKVSDREESPTKVLQGHNMPDVPSLGKESGRSLAGQGQQELLMVSELSQDKVMFLETSTISQSHYVQVENAKAMTTVSDWSTETRHCGISLDNCSGDSTVADHIKSHEFLQTTEELGHTSDRLTTDTTLLADKCTAFPTVLQHCGNHMQDQGNESKLACLTSTCISILSGDTENQDSENRRQPKFFVETGSKTRTDIICDSFAVDSVGNQTDVSQTLSSSDRHVDSCRTLDHVDKMKLPTQPERNFSEVKEDSNPTVQNYEINLHISTDLQSDIIDSSQNLEDVMLECESGKSLVDVINSIEVPAEIPDVEVPAEAPDVELPNEVHVLCVEISTKVPAILPGFEVPAVVSDTKVAIEIPSAEVSTEVPGVEVPAIAPDVEVPAEVPGVTIPTELPAIVPGVEVYIGTKVPGVEVPTEGPGVEVPPAEVPGVEVPTEGSEGSLYKNKCSVEPRHSEGLKGDKSSEVHKEEPEKLLAFLPPLETPGKPTQNDSVVIGVPRRFKNREELLEFKRKQKQQQTKNQFTPVTDGNYTLDQLREKNSTTQLTPLRGLIASSLETTTLGTLMKQHNSPSSLKLEMKPDHLLQGNTFSSATGKTGQTFVCQRASSDTADSKETEMNIVEGFLEDISAEPVETITRNRSSITDAQIKVEVENVKENQPGCVVPSSQSKKRSKNDSDRKRKTFSSKESPTNERLSEPKDNLSTNNSSGSQLASVTSEGEKASSISGRLIGKNVPSEMESKRCLKVLTAKEVTPQLSEILRKIGTPTDLTFKYRKGAKVATSEGLDEKNLLYPIHRYVGIDNLSDKKSRVLFSRDVIQFACACLNDRVNGVIHFGISSGKENSGAVYGEIVGIQLNEDTNAYGDFLRKAIRKCFLESQTEAALQCISTPEFIETLSPGNSREPRRFVIEVDVIPKHRFCLEEVFYVKLPTSEKGKLEDESMFRVTGGEMKKLTPNEESEFKKNVKLLAMERKELEDRLLMKKKIEIDLSKKFVHLFCHGEEALLGDHYQILVINKPEGHVDVEMIKNTLSFIADIEWKIVFDFDPDAMLCNYVQEQEKPIKILMADDFHPNSRRNVQSGPEDRLKQMLEDLKNSDCTTWCFTNGYAPLDQPEFSPRQWKKNFAESFKEAVRFFNAQIPQGRATVVFLLLSKELGVMLEAADELMTTFDDQWMCLAESEEIGKPWIEELIRRNCIEPENFDKNVVWGMPWKHVQETVKGVLGPKKHGTCMLVSSTGTHLPVNNKIINELTDLQILSCRECNDAEVTNDKYELRKHQKQVEEEFYKGECVSWWNFWFEQVCRRDILEIAKKQIQSAATSEDDPVGKVFLFHQAGAGGTTFAKNILWEFRDTYRCAVVHKINEAQTAEQVLKLFWYEDNNPKPVLILLDNPEVDKLNLLYSDLSDTARNMVRNNERQRVVCVLLVCSRHRGKIDDAKKLMLKHELSKRELVWFQNRYKRLTFEYESGQQSDMRSASAVHPRLLISFNVMKENFNQAYIRRTVKELLHDVTDSKECRLLKYVSLLNTFDLECRPLPTASFDGMMIDGIPYLNQSGLRYGSKAISKRWETKLSQGARVLLNETSETAMGRIHSLRIASSLLSLEILYVLRDNGAIPVGEIAKEFLCSRDIFGSSSLARDNLVSITKDVLKRRQQKGGKPEKSFSPLIQYILDNETFDSAVEVMEQVLTITPDPFIDQQLARLYIKMQNWNKASDYAKKATEQKPENSFLWDTYGRVYENQLAEEYDKLAKDALPRSIGDLTNVIKIALEGMKAFRKVQETSEKEKTTILANKAGFFGELQIVACLLDCLNIVFKDMEDLKKFILEPHYVPPDCQVLADVNGENYLQELKELEKHVQQAMNRLEDELIQLRDDTLHEYQPTRFTVHEIDSLSRLKEHLDLYFGEENDAPPANLSEKDKCDFRRRRVFRIASRNIGSIFDLRWRQPDGMEKLKRIQSIAKQNLTPQHANAEDYLVLICVHLALLSMDNSKLYDKGIRFDDMAKWSMELYRLRETFVVIHLEPYLFYIMFNWPRRNTKHAVAPKLIEIALRQWKDAYYKKYPRQQDEGKPYRKKDTTMFFLANGSDMASIYTTYEERGSKRMNEHKGRDSFWRMPDTLRKLQRFDGILSRDGNEVSVYLQYKEGNKAPIAIPTSLPIRSREMWNKKVFFVIGFSWNGPRAFDVTLTDPTLECDMATGHTVLKPNVPYPMTLTFTSSRRPGHDYIHGEYNREFSEIREELSHIKLIQNKLDTNRSYKPDQEELKLLSKKRDLERRLDTLLQTRRRDMDFRIPDFNMFTMK